MTHTVYFNCYKNNANNISYNISIGGLGWRVCFRSGLVPGPWWPSSTWWLCDLHGLSLVHVGWLQPVDGDRILAVSKLEDKMLFGPFDHFVRSLVGARPVIPEPWRKRVF